MSLFKKPNELETNSTIKMLIYGQPGMGKSTLALSAPDPVMFDFDGGVNRVNKAFQCPTLQVQNWEQVTDALDELASGDISFQTIVIDTAGKMLDFMSDYIMRNDSKMKMRDGSLALKGYGARKVMFVEFLKRVTMMGKNIVFVAHEKEDKDGDTRIVRPDMGGSSLGDLLKELDLVGYMQAIGEERAIYWSPQEKFYAKNTCNLPQFNKIPTIINAQAEVVGQNNFLTNVFASYNRYLAQQASIGNDYVELIAQIEADIASITDVDTANKAVERIGSYNAIWDSKARANKLITAKCGELGLTYNRATKKYEQAAA
ncbi:ATP-binding protein [Sodaliphilus pleomorphus]|jgi:phage nucleotide-binding protein|uniref:ATP-binding protein n=1 Tax=Sodaliphilus pleomorphus TaxID=2606626 RepID=A0A6L5XBF2_9BACT|nr:ATP-binding protein [Sodaliphilus pleomorphus]MSS16845.1 ATP-binding protein [Sodaliphilus pleomorphus]